MPTGNPRPRQTLERSDLRCRPIAATRKIGCGDQENVLHAGVSLGARQPLGAVFGRAGQSEGVRDLSGTVFGNRSGIVRGVVLISAFANPVQVRGAGIRKERLAGTEPASHQRAPPSWPGPTATTNVTGKLSNLRPVRCSPACKCTIAARTDAG